MHNLLVSRVARALLAVVMTGLPTLRANA